MIKIAIQENKNIILKIFSSLWCMTNNFFEKILLDLTKKVIWGICLFFKYRGEKWLVSKIN